jgi:hypothetical protein
MDRQATYNKVRDHLLAQGERSMDDEVCAYRSPDGLRCAVGCLIPDNLEIREGERVGSLCEALPQVREALGIADPREDPDQHHSDLSFLSMLQNIHDQGTPAHWPALLTTFAKREGLEP